MEKRMKTVGEVKKDRRIYVQSLDKLRITKIHYNKLWFKNGDDEYMICSVEYEDGDRNIILNGVDRDENGHAEYDQIMIKNIGDKRLDDFIHDVSKNGYNLENHVYKNLDIEYFARRMVYFGLMTGIFRREYEEIDKNKKEMTKEIERLQRKIKEEEDNFCKKSKHSRDMTTAFKIKVCDRNLDKAHKNGEYCELYNDYYGNTHPEWNGVLTDIRGLPCGSEFLCCNEFSYWNGVVWFDDYLNKVVLRNNSVLNITDEYNGLYIIKKED